MLFYTGSLFPAWSGNLFIGGLTQKDPTNLTRLVLKGDRVVAEERLLTEIVPRERLRDVRQGPDGAIYVVTDGPKGRIFKIVPKK
jgi:glucose/arabinose dehydrogenase